MNIKCIRPEESKFIQCVFDTDKCIYFIPGNKNEFHFCVSRENVYKFLENGEWVRQPDDCIDSVESTAKGLIKKLKER